MSKTVSRPLDRPACRAVHLLPSPVALSLVTVTPPRHTRGDGDAL